MGIGEDNLMSNEIIYEKKTENTPRYDKVGHELTKLMVGSMAKFIPDLADALREDWYPHLTKDMIQKNEEVRDIIAHKIVGDWSKQENENGLWSTKGIRNYIPSWLKDPELIESGKEQRAAQIVKRYQKRIESQKEVFDLIKQLPEPPKEEPELDPVTSYSTGGVSEPPIRYVPTPLEVYENSIQGFARAWRIMTHKDYIPGVGEDVKRDYIDGSRKFRLRLLKGLDEADANHYHNILVWIEMLVRDTLNLWDEIQREKRQKVTQ